MSDVIDYLHGVKLPILFGFMIVGFILFWPIGLALLVYLFWSRRMGCGVNSMHGDWREMNEKFRGRRWKSHRSSGNAAFDEYREETLRRLEEEHRDFQAFLKRLRMAKDRAEFDQFMSGQRNQSTPRDDDTYTEPFGPGEPQPQT